VKPALSRWIRLSFGTAITISCLWLALRKVPVGGMRESLEHVRWSWIVTALMLLAVGYTARIYRWWLMLRASNPAVSLRACAWPLIVGFAVNNVVPFRAGDVVRAVGFKERLGASAPQVLGSLVVERILDLTILLIALVVGIVGLTGGTSSVPVSYQRTAAIMAGFGIMGWALLLVVGDQLESVILRALQHRSIASRAWVSSAEHHVKTLFLALKLVRAPERALGLLAISTVVWVCEGGVFWAVANSLEYRGSPLGPWFALATGSLSTLIPSSPGYVGTFEFFTISGFTAYGASNSIAAAAALIVHGVLWLPLTMTGLGYLLVRPVFGGPSSQQVAQTQERM